MFQNGGKGSINVCFLTEQSVPVPFGGILSWTPLIMKKGPVKLQKGAHLILIGQFLEETLYYYELKIPSKSKLGIAQQREITLKFQK